MNRFGVLSLTVVLLLALMACRWTETVSPRVTPPPAAPAPTLAPAPTIAAPAPATPASAATSVPAPPAATQVPPPEPTATPLPKPERKPTSIPVPTPVPAVFPFTVIDSNGDEVTFEEPPGRIVAFDSAVVEILFAIGEGGRIVGTHDFVSYPPEAATIPRLGSAFSMNIEATVALQPDLVFIFFDAFKADLERAGLKVLYLQSLGGDFIKIAETVRLWGGIVGQPGIAEEVATDFEDRVQSIRDVMESYESGPSVFQDDGALWTPGPDTLLGEVFEMLKLRNIAHDISGYAQLSPEVVVDRNPQVIILSFGDDISGNPAFQNVEAVKNGRMYTPPSDALHIAGPRFVDGIEELARWVYPGVFR